MEKTFHHAPEKGYLSNGSQSLFNYKDIPKEDGKRFTKPNVSIMIF
jgi:hypothetical protein